MRITIELEKAFDEFGRDLVKSLFVSGMENNVFPFKAVMIDGISVIDRVELEQRKKEQANLKYKLDKIENVMDDILEIVGEQ